MSDPCPHCGRPMAEVTDRDRLALMRDACMALGIIRTWDDHVSERDAARLLGRSAKTLRNRRGLDQPLDFRKRGGRVEYSLMSVAAWGAGSK